MAGGVTPVLPRFGRFFELESPAELGVEAEPAGGGPEPVKRDSALNPEELFSLIPMVVFVFV